MAEVYPGRNAGCEHERWMGTSRVSYVGKEDTQGEVTSAGWTGSGDRRTHTAPSVWSGPCRRHTLLSE